MIGTDRPVLSLAQLEAFDPHPGGGPTERRYNCPLDACRDKPVDRGHQALCVNVDSGLYLCNRCGARGKLRERWDERSVQDVRRARARAHFTLSPERQPGTAQTAAVLPDRLAACRPLAGSPGEDYLFRRGIGLDVAVPAGVLYAPGWSAHPDGRRPAVVFPMKDPTGRVVAANGRYLTVPEGRTKTLVLGDRRLGAFATLGALEARDATLVVVEGPCDALALAICDVPAVALVCTQAPPWLPSAAVFRRVLIALDADAEGDRASEEIAAQLAPFAASVQRLRPPQGKDWNDALLADYAGLCEFLQAAGL